MSSEVTLLHCYHPISAIGCTLCHDEWKRSRPDATPDDPHSAVAFREKTQAAERAFNAHQAAMRACGLDETPASVLTPWSELHFAEKDAWLQALRAASSSDKAKPSVAELQAALSEAISRTASENNYEDLHRKFGHLLAKPTRPRPSGSETAPLSQGTLSEIAAVEVVVDDLDITDATREAMRTAFARLRRERATPETQERSKTSQSPASQATGGVGAAAGERGSARPDLPSLADRDSGESASPTGSGGAERVVPLPAERAVADNACYADLRQRMVHHQVVGDTAVVVVTAAELSDLLDAASSRKSDPETAPLCPDCGWMRGTTLANSHAFDCPNFPRSSDA